MKKLNWLACGGCGFAALLCIMLVNPRAEIGMEDDWSYVLSAWRLAKTGHVIYNGWGAMSLGVQLYAGAVFARLFGYSFLAVRASTMVIFVLSAMLAYAIFSRCGVRPWNAVFGAITCTLSPVSFAMGTTYMSDGWGMFFVLLFFYLAIRSETAATESATLLWLAAAAVAAVAGGSVRQIVFLCNLAALPALVFTMRRRRGVVVGGATIWLAAFAVSLAIMHWFKQQPYVAVEPLYHLPHLRGELRRVWLPSVARSFIECLLLVLPVLAAVALKLPLRERQSRQRIFFIVGLCASVVALVSLVWGGTIWGELLLGFDFRGRGIPWDILRDETATASAVPEMAAAFVFLTTLGMIPWAVACFRGEVKLSSLDRALLCMAVPFTAFYLGLVFTRAVIYDRYFLPLIFLAVLLAMRWFELRFATRVSWISAIPLAAMVMYGVAASHDRYAAGRAELAAITLLRDSGVPRNEIDAGFEYNGLTETENTGYVNEPRLFPAGLYKPMEVPAALAALHPRGMTDGKCYSFFYTYTPSIHARFGLQNASNYCFPDATAYGPIVYTTWLQPRIRRIYVAAIPRFENTQTGISPTQ